MDKSIEFGDSDKENEISVQSTTVRTRCSKDQIEYMEKFLKDHNESLDATQWDILTVELNAIGPVVQTSSKWRRSWSVRKYNLKKQVQKSMAEVDDMESTASQDVPSNSCQPDPTDQTSIWHTVLEQLEIFNQRQDAMDKKIDKISNHIFKNHSSELL